MTMLQYRQKSTSLQKVHPIRNQLMRLPVKSSGASGEMVLIERRGSLLPDMIILQYRKG